MNQYIPCKAAARFLWRQPDGCWREACGITRNIHRFGVFICSDAAPSPGAEVQVIVTMCSPEAAEVTGQLCGKGVVVRVENREGQPTGFAAEVLFPSGWASLFPPTDNSQPAVNAFRYAEDFPAWIPSCVAKPALYASV
jgi:hypothetical protein